MSNKRSWNFVALTLLLAAAVAAGCAKKQTVKSGVDSGGPTATAPAPAAPGVTETPIAPPAPPVMAAKPAEAAPGVAVTQERPSRFADVLFDFDKSTLRDDGKKASQDVADFMKKTPGAVVLIEGHCDERGTAEYNLALGDRRATAVKNYIVSLGIPAASLSTVSFGEERPLDPGHSEDAWSKNRRAHFVLK